jgi:hypothetical protein
MTASVQTLEGQVAEAARIHQQTSNAVQTALTSLKQAADAADQTFQIHEQRFGEADAALARALENLRSGVDEVAGATQVVFGEYEQHIKSAVGSLSVWAQGMEDSTSDLADAIGDLTKAMPRSAPTSPAARRWP